MKKLIIGLLILGLLLVGCNMEEIAEIEKEFLNNSFNEINEESNCSIELNESNLTMHWAYHPIQICSLGCVIVSWIDPDNSNSLNDPAIELLGLNESNCGKCHYY